MSNDERPAQPVPTVGLIRDSSFMIRYSIFARGFVLLIALSGRQVGAMIVTQDARDPALLRRHLRFDFAILS